MDVIHPLRRRFIVTVLGAIVSLTMDARAEESAASAAAPGIPKIGSTLSNTSLAGESKESLPLRVDLRPRFAEWGLSQRRQGKRGTCSVFATVEALEFAIAHAGGSRERLSVEFANWAANAATRRTDDGDFFHNIIRGINAYGICSERAMSYQAKFSAEHAPSADALEEAVRFRDSHEVAFHWIRPWNRKPGLEPADIDRIKAVLAKGFPVSAGSYHSVLFVGFEDDASLAGGGRFLVADSEERERELTYEAAIKRMSDLFWVEVKPKPSS